MNKSYVIRPYRPEDKEQVLNLIKLEWGDNIATKFKEIYEWRFIDNPAACQHDKVGNLVIDCDNQVTGFLSLMPINMKVFNKTQTCIWGGELITHPEHRGRGHRLIKYAQKNFNALMLGTPNPIAHRLEIAMKFRDIVRLKNMIFINNMGKIISRYYPILNLIKPLINTIWYMIIKIITIWNKLFFTTNLSFNKIIDFNSDINKFWNNVSVDYDIITARDDKYLNWRFAKYPLSTYDIYLIKSYNDIIGYVVLRFEELDGIKYGHLVDYLTGLRDKKTFRYLMRSSVAVCLSKNVDIITCKITPTQNFYKNLLRNNGFFFTTEKEPVVAYTNNPEIPWNLIENPNSWFLTRADSDMDMMDGGPQNLDSVGCSDSDP